MKQYLVATTPKFFVTNKYTLAKWHMEDIIIKKLTSPMVNTVGVETVNKYWTPFYFWLRHLHTHDLYNNYGWKK